LGIVAVYPTLGFAAQCRLWIGAKLGEVFGGKWQESAPSWRIYYALGATMRADDGYVEWLMRCYGIPRADAEDVLQASLLRIACAHRAEHPDANETELQAYLDALPEGVLYRTLHWQACNRLRARRREQTMLACWMQQSPCEDDPEQAAVERVYAEWLASLLPDGAREIHALLEAGYTWDEIATQLGVSPSAAKMRFQRGGAQVRQKLGLGCDDLAVCGVNKDGGRKTGVAPIETRMKVCDEKSSEVAEGSRRSLCEYAPDNATCDGSTVSCAKG
jgi:DNA-directed RNA polymerase specialized sigma24 family protein